MKKLLALLALFPLTLTADWTQFRGPAGQGHSTSAKLPVRWSKNMNVAWRQSIPGSGWSSPIIHSGKIYMTTAVKLKGGALSLEVYCLDVARGKGVWKQKLFHVSKENVVSINKKNSHATPTPVIDAGKLYVHFGHLGTACLDLQGNVIWKNDTIKYPPVHGGACSPVIAGDKLFFSCDGARNAFVIALNRGTGKVAWRKLRNMNGKRQFSFCTPLVIELDGKQQIVSPGSDAVIAYEPASGREIWKVRYPDGYSVVPRPVYGHGLVYVCTGFGQASLFAIKPDGSGDVTDSHVVWKTNRSVPHTPSLLLVDEEIYMVSDNGIATCRNAKTGEEIWKERLGGKYSSSPIFAAGRAYFLSEDGKTVVMQLGKSHKIIATNELKERSLASFAVDGNSLFIRTEKNLYKIGR